MTPLRTHCPYCNSGATFFKQTTSSFEQYTQYSVGCSGSGCKIKPQTLFVKDEAEAVAIWDGWLKDRFQQDDLPPVGVVDH